MQNEVKEKEVLGYELIIYTNNGMTVSDTIHIQDIAFEDPKAKTEVEYLMETIKKLEDAWVARKNGGLEDSLVHWNNLRFFVSDVCMFKLRPVYSGDLFLMH